MALYTLRSQRDVANMLNAPKYNPNSQVVFNAIGRDAGSQNNDNFFTKRAKSVGNAVGTTGAAVASFFKDNAENASTENELKNAKNRMNDIAKGYGYNTFNDWSDAYAKATEAGDTAKIKQFEEQNEAFKKQSDANHEMMTKKAADYRDWMENNDVSKYIQQDRGKFAGSAMNTLSTGFDVLSMAAGIPNGPVVNGIQGAWEGVADELEQNGLENFDLKRAGQNAAIGAASGAATGALNKGVNNILAKKGGNLLKGGNKLTAGLNKWNSTNPVGRVLSTVGTGAARGAQSGLVGGAVGAGLSSAMNGVDIGEGIANTVQGALQGAKAGATTGGIMAGANLATNAALNKVAPKMMEKVRANQMRNAGYGDTLREQFKGAWDSGDSAVAEKMAKPMLAKAASTVGEATGKINAFSQNLAFQNAIKNPAKMGEPVYLGELSQDDVQGVIEAYKNAGIDLANDPDALEAITVQNGKMYLSPENAQHIHDSRIVNDGATPRQVRKVFRNATGKDGVVSPELTDRGNATMGALRKDGGADISHLSVEDDGTISVRTAYKTRSGKMAKQIKNTLGSSELPSTDASGSEGLPGRTSALQGTDTIIPQRTENVNSQWDNIAQEAGYRNYNEAVQRFMEANPNAKVDAGSVLTWLDNNQGGWNPNMPSQDVENPETEIYRKFTTEIEQTPQEVLTGKQIKAKRAIVEDITDQFRAVDKPTARGTHPQETFYNLYEDWGLSDGDDIRQAVSYAEPGSLIPQMIREAAGEAGVIDLSDAQGMVLDLGLKKNSNYKKTVAVLSDIWDSMPNEDVVGGKSGVDALKFQRAIEQAASDAQGTSGEYHIGNNVVDQTTAKNLMRIANNIGDRLDEAATAKGAVQNVLSRHAGDIQEMRNAFPQNSKWQDQIDSRITGAQTIRDLRSSIKDLTRANIYITNGDENYATFGGRYSNSNTNIPTTKSGLINRAANWVYDKAADSKVARNFRLNRNSAIVNDDATTPAPTTTQTTTTPTTATYNPATQVYNAIGRNEGLTNGEQARTAGYLADAVNQNTAAGNGTLEGLVSTPTVDGSTSVYNSVYGNQPATLTSNQSTGYFQPTGDYWTDILATAMSSAIDADDADAFVALYEMYQDALSKQQSASTSSQKLTATQQRANAAMNSLQRLANMTPDLGYNLSNIPVVGNIATLGGNDYESEAKSLAQQIGYMVSGSNIKDSEAENIGKSYVPQPWDNEQTRQNKLRRAYEIIQQYQNGYATE